MWIIPTYPLVFATRIERQHDEGNPENLEVHSYSEYFFGQVLPIFICFFKIHSTQEEIHKQNQMKELETKVKQQFAILNIQLKTNEKMKRVFSSISAHISHCKEIFQEASKVFDLDLLHTFLGQE